MTLRRDLPSPLLISAFAALLIALATVRAGDAADGFERGAGIVGVLALVVVAFAARPSVTITAGIVVGIFNSHFHDMGIPFAADRLLLVAGVASVIAREVDAGGFWRLRGDPVHWLMALAAVYALTSALVAGTWDDSVARYALVDRYGLIPFAMFFVAPFAFRDARDRQILLVTLVVLGAYLGLLALIETVGPRSLIWPRYIDDRSIGIHYDRARGPFVEAAANGLVLFMCAVASVMATQLWRDRTARAIAGVVAGLCALGILFSLTRAPWIGAVGGTLLALLAARETRRYVLPLVGVGVVLIAGAFLTVPGLQDRATSRTNDKLPVYDRQNSNDAALRMVDAKPLVGFGWGRYAYDSVPYYRLSPDIPLRGVREVHNIFLSNAVELGLLGALLWIAALAAAFGGAVLKRGPPELRLWKIALVALLFCWLMVAITNPLAFVMPTVLLWVWAGIARGSREQRAAVAR